MAAPPLTLTAQPVEAGKALYLKVAPSTASGKEQIKLSLRLRLRNDHATQALTLKDIVFSFPGSAHPPFPMQGEKIAVSTGADPDPDDGVIPAGTTATWSNGVVDLDTSEAGENKISNVVYLDVPAPPKVKVEVSCQGYTDPVSLTLDLLPFTKPTDDGALILPFLPTDLDDGEYIVTSARHWANGGANGTQIFAHDISVQARKPDGSWSGLKAGKDNSRNEHHRIHGLPVRALADGTVISWKDDTPENPKPGEKLDIKPLEGNHFWVRHGSLKVKYAHLIPGSLPAALRVEGAAVRAGQKLGLAGNSGNSDGPHLHLEAHDFATGTLRALPFKNAWVLKRDHPAAVGGPWVRLTEHGIPYDTSAIWPASTAPRTIVAAAGIARAGDWASSFWTSPDRASFEQQAQTLFEQKGRRLIAVATYREGSARRWVGIARAGDWASSFWVSDSRAAFEAKAQQLFDQKGQRLIHVSTFPEGAGRRWVGIARGGDWASSFWISDTRAAFEAKAQQLFDQKGQRLVHVTTYRDGAARRWVGLARSGDWASSFWISDDRAAFETKAQQLFDQQGRRLIHVHTYLEGAARRWVGIARSGDWANSYLFERDIDSFRRRAQDLFDENGRRLVCVEILDDEA